MQYIKFEIKKLKFINSASASASATGVRIDQAGKIYDAILYPYADLSGAINTQIVLLFDSTAIHAASNNFIVLGSVVALGGIAFLFVFFFVYLGRVEKFI